MQRNAVKTLMHNIQWRYLPTGYVEGDPAAVSWGVGFSPNAALKKNPSMFACISAKAASAVHEFLQHDAEMRGKEPPDSDTPEPQAILDYKDDRWLLKFESYNNENAEETLHLDENTVRELLTRLRASGVRVYDVMCHDVW